LNIQPIEKREHRDDGQLAVHSIFLTIQGEGPFCGTPCVFVRLAGCNLQCPACDTDYTSKRELIGPGEVLARVNELWRAERWRRGLVVVTGGEPFRQQLDQLFEMLCTNGYYVQVESNGTLQPTPNLGNPATKGWSYSTRPDNRRGVYVVCSPKTGKLHPDIYRVACALKYVVRYGQVEEDGLPSHALDHLACPARPPEDWGRPIYIQPLDSGNVVDNDFHTVEAKNSCLRHGYTLQLQIHKLIGVE
jgi:7-carboxy-7-deazaguanine synthase